ASVSSLASVSGATALSWSALCPESSGSPLGSSKSGTGTSGRLAAATVNGSLDVPAWAGATVVAASVAHKSIAERKDGNMKSAIFAVNHNNTQAGIT